MDSGKIGPWRALANTGNKAFADPEVNFLIVCDEDTLVADDVLDLLMWERAQFEKTRGCCWSMPTRGAPRAGTGRG